MKRAAAAAMPAHLQLAIAAVTGTTPAPAPAKKKRVKKPKPPPVYVPHDCALLCVDGSENSGWSIWSRGVLRAYGECDLFSSGPREVFERFLRDFGGPHVIVIERPFYMKWGTQSTLGMGAKIWGEHAKRRSFGKRIVRVYPSVWRACALGRGWGSKKRNLTRAREQELAPLLVREHLGVNAPPIGADAAPAILIGKWATFAGEVLAVLPKRRVLVKGEQAALAIAKGRGRGA